MTAIISTFQFCFFFSSFKEIHEGREVSHFILVEYFTSMVI
jgi:hypothetical protein